VTHGPEKDHNNDEPERCLLGEATVSANRLSLHWLMFGIAAALFSLVYAVVDLRPQVD
jgi:hypothetical protein